MSILFVIMVNMSNSKFICATCICKYLVNHKRHMRSAEDGIRTYRRDKSWRRKWNVLLCISNRGRENHFVTNVALLGVRDQRITEVTITECTCALEWMMTNDLLKWEVRDRVIATIFVLSHHHITCRYVAELEIALKIIVWYTFHEKRMYVHLWYILIMKSSTNSLRKASKRLYYHEVYTLQAHLIFTRENSWWSYFSNVQRFWHDLGDIRQWYPRKLGGIDIETSLMSLMIVLSEIFDNISRHTKHINHLLD